MGNTCSLFETTKGANSGTDDESKQEKGFSLVFQGLFWSHWSNYLLPNECMHAPEPCMYFLCTTKSLNATWNEQFILGAQVQSPVFWGKQQNLQHWTSSPFWCVQISKNTEIGSGVRSHDALTVSANLGTKSKGAVMYAKTKVDLQDALRSYSGTLRRHSFVSLFRRKHFCEIFIFSVPWQILICSRESLQKNTTVWAPLAVIGATILLNFRQNDGSRQDFVNIWLE